MNPSTLPNRFLRLAATLYGYLIRVATWLQPVFLLIIRVYIGYQFILTGKGKLSDIPRVTGYFQSLHIPFPMLNAYIAGSNECFGGVLLLLGLAARFASIPLTITMAVAYLTASPDAVTGFFHNSDPFFKDDAFPFLMTAVIIFLFGPGPISLDGLIGRLLKPRLATEPVVAEPVHS